MSQNLVYVGKIVSPHGINGKVKILSFAEDPESLSNYDFLSDSNGKNKITVTNCKIIKGKTLMAEIKNVTSRSEAERIRGKHLYLDKNKLPQLEDEEYFFSDLIGLEVEDEYGNTIGNIKEVYDFGAGNIIEIKKTNIEETFMLPFHISFFPKIEKNKRVIVSLPETKTT